MCRNFKPYKVLRPFVMLDGVVELTPEQAAGRRRYLRHLHDDVYQIIEPNRISFRAGEIIGVGHPEIEMWQDSLELLPGTFD